MSMLKAPPVNPPTLSDDARTILRAILERKLVRGGELLAAISATRPEGLIEPIKELLNAKLIEASGLSGGLNPESVLFATFGTLPSAQRALRDLVSW